MSELAKIIVSAVLAIFFTVWALIVIAQIIKKNDDDDTPPPGAVVAGAAFMSLAGAWVLK